MIERTNHLNFQSAGDGRDARRRPIKINCKLEIVADSVSAGRYSQGNRILIKLNLINLIKRVSPSGLCSMLGNKWPLRGFKLENRFFFSFSSWRSAESFRLDLSLFLSPSDWQTLRKKLRTDLFPFAFLRRFRLIDSVRALILANGRCYRWILQARRRSVTQTVWVKPQNKLKQRIKISTKAKPLCDTCDRLLSQNG